jgi:hypothetical protein
MSQPHQSEEATMKTVGGETASRGDLTSAHLTAESRARVALQVGHVVQLIPDVVRNPMFAGCFMTITEPKTWGAQGYVQALGESELPGGQAYYRAKWEEMSDPIGMAEFIVGDQQ